MPLLHSAAVLRVFRVPWWHATAERDLYVTKIKRLLSTAQPDQQWRECRTARQEGQLYYKE